MSDRSIRARWHRLVEDHLPWYDPMTEAKRDAETERKRQDAIDQRIKVERVIEEYRYADTRSRRNVDRLIAEYRAENDRARKSE